MRKVYKKRLLLILIYSIFIFYTFYVILKTSSKFGNTNKNINEENILDTGAIDIADLKDSKNINGYNKALNSDLNNFYDENDNINNVDIDDNNTDGKNNVKGGNDIDDDNNIVEGDNNMEEADKMENEDDNNNLDSENNESENNESENNENENENNIDNDNNIDIDNNMDGDNNIDNDYTLENGDNNGDEEDIQKIKEQLSNENNDDGNNTNEEQFIGENDGDNNDDDNNDDGDNDNNENEIENENENQNAENENDTTNNNDEKKQSNKTFKKYSSDLGYVLNYDGGEIEPEWDWIRNISIVYTWVDGSDVNFADEKAKYNGGFRDSTSRDRSADELKYSIRSVEKYLPWHNGTIYILTHSQVPKWLDTSNPRIKMVYHKDIFPEHVYPTYDSATIEAFLDKIPGVTERFIYFNDDVFLNKYVHPCFFFTRENFYPQIYRRFPVTLEENEINKIIAENNIHMIFTASKYYTRKLAREYFDDKFEYCDLFHTPHVYYRDLMEPFRQLFHEEFKEIFSNRFRNGRKFVTQYLFQVYMQYATQHPEFPLKLGGNGKARNFVGKPLPEYATIKRYSVRIVSGKVGDYLVKFGKITDSSRRNKRYFNYIKNHKALLVYNFNDAYTKESALHEFTDFMISQYPEPSSFEKKEYIDLEAPFAKKIVQINDFLKELIIDLRHTFSLKNLNSMKIMIIRHRINVARDYINRKNFFVQQGKRISDREEEEINELSTYEGETLTEEWEWAKHMSMVYIVNNKEGDLNRDINMEKLKYSLRSIEKYLPWFDGKIYLISQDENNEGLSWVNKNHKNIEIIYYRDILPAESHPTKNKRVIELFLDNIPQLSEKFVYLKENHFFKRYTHPRFFFSKEFYPKYNFKDVIPIDKHFLSIRSSDPFFYTGKAVVRYFGDSYVNSFRHMENAPCSLYRDLFKPVRELFMIYIRNALSQDNGGMDLLPIYLVANYNIYATAQPYYPEYVSGYGTIRKFPSPMLNPERTVKYYGFDITSQAIADKTICAKTFLENSSDNQFMLQEIENTTANFFSIDADKLESLDQDAIKTLLNKFYEEKSSFEN